MGLKMGNEVITAENIFMRFNLASERTETLKEYAIKLVKRKLMFTEFFALRGVSFSVRRGEAVALIGRNGSGKSTMLKIIAGVMSATSGRVSVKGSLAPLIELGAGFDMNLTARENIFLNGAILGHDRKYMAEHFESIVDFAELRNFLDVPVKNFSSGMIARLGFAIATEVSADILVCDEILAVGDMAFQEKCHRRISEMLAGGTTLLFVSHSIEAVKKMCGRAIWLDGGQVVADGESAEVCERYQDAVGGRQWQ